MEKHNLKTWIEYFTQVWDGKKNFEVRKNDRNFKVGDTLILREWDNVENNYTGRYMYRKIKYILNGGQFGIEEGYVVISI